MFASTPSTCTRRTLDLPRKDWDIRYLRYLGNSDIAIFPTASAIHAASPCRCAAPIPAARRPGGGDGRRAIAGSASPWAEQRDRHGACFEASGDLRHRAASAAQNGLLAYSEEQNVVADVAGRRAAVVIEAVETHTRTGFVNVDLGHVPDLDPAAVGLLSTSRVEVPVTHAKIFGWYDNDYGSYTNLLGDLTVHVHQHLD